MEVVGHDNEGDAILLLNLEQKVSDLASGFAIESTSWLVGQNDPRLVDEGAGDGGALFFAAGKFAGAVVQAVVEADSFQECEGAFAGLLLTFLPTASKPWREDIFEDRQLREEVVLLEDEPELAVPKAGRFLFVEAGNVLPTDFHRATGWREKGSEDVEQSGFATARGTHHGCRSSFLDRKIETLEDFDDFAGGLELDFQIADLDHAGKLATFLSSQSPHSTNLSL